MNSEQEIYVQNVAKIYGVWVYGLMSRLNIVFHDDKYIVEDRSYSDLAKAIRYADKIYQAAECDHEDVLPDVEFKKLRISKESKIVLWMSGLGLLIWPMFVFATIMALGAPGKISTMQYISVGLIIGYPVTLLISFMLSYSTTDVKKSSASIYWACVPISSIVVALYLLGL